MGANKAASGGGVCIKSNSSSATFIMEGANPTISQNKASGESNKTYGGGVALMTVGEFKMKSGIIKQNDAENGSGVSRKSILPEDCLKSCSCGRMSA
ncbi:hypothetical protein [Treponema socranskii]|uniref:hypothetical protein n=1 Tax=Treponema socranskii TaxID=53419 RepID=UPI003D6F5D58